MTTSATEEVVEVLVPADALLELSVPVSVPQPAAPKTKMADNPAAVIFLNRRHNPFQNFKGPYVP